jgi:hypothetical protein
MEKQAFVFVEYILHLPSKHSASTRQALPVRQSVPAMQGKQLASATHICIVPPTLKWPRIGALQKDSANA